MNDCRSIGNFSLSSDHKDKWDRAVLGNGDKLTPESL